MDRIILFTLIFVPCIISKSTLNGFLPNLPVGEYKVYARAFIKCKPTEGNLIEANLYMYKISVNSSEIRGNITFKKPIDDSYNMDINFAVKDSIGGWKENAYFFQIDKACTKAIYYLGSAVSTVANNFSFNATCPIPVGVYVSKGLDFTQVFSQANIPKQFFYGTYKYRIDIIDNKKKQVGCGIIIMDKYEVSFVATPINYFVENYFRFILAMMSDRHPIFISRIPLEQFIQSIRFHHFDHLKY
ncbi:Hypothetical protein CINCED_3A002932 [Cinara cedri]|uniref:Uncharacterized protein n=1 Tax=Cinara cedri TaxID=506608 RepID=A0A5E4NQ73_9HEMI|nr:Hypothetical protein CINCED_3A002932 [Cinara cedri]